MIEYVEIRSRNTRKVIGIIDAAQSVIWHSVYFGVGDFEIYANATAKHLDLLKEGNFVSRPDNSEIGIIEDVTIKNSIEDGVMITASGRLAKSILDRRHIYNLSGKSNRATILSGNVESAVRATVVNNAINCTFDTARNIPFLELGANAGINKIIIDDNGNATQKQVSYQNLLSYTDEVLEEYNLGATVEIDDDTYKLQYRVYEGADRSYSNTQGNSPVVFSPEFDNLTESSYSLNTAIKKTAALIGGEGEGIDRFYSVIAGNEKGFERRETWVDANSISKKYQDGEQEREYTDAQYKAMLDALGKQQLATLISQETFDGTVNLNGGMFKLNEHYALGDIVTIQDNKIGVYINARIVELLEKDDADGYSIYPTFKYDDTTILYSLITTESGLVITTEGGASIAAEGVN